MSRKLKLLALAVLWVITVSVVSADTFSGVDLYANSSDPHLNSLAAAAAFESAASQLGQIGQIDFESTAVGPLNGATLLATGVSATPGIAGMFSIANSPLGSPDYTTGYNTTAGGRNFLQLTNDVGTSLSGGTVTFDFADPVHAFGAYLSGAWGSQASIWTDNQVYVFPIEQSQVPGGGGVSFFGFVDPSVYVTSISFHGTTFGAIDDLFYVSAGSGDGNGGQNQVPEPGTLFLSLTGCMCAAASARFRARGRRMSRLRDQP